MESNAFALRTGIFLISAVIVVAIGWSLLDANARETVMYRVVSEESVSGLAPKARVYYKGVEVGTVEEIFFAAPDFDRVNILIAVDMSIPIAQNTYAQLALRGITGEYDLRLDNDGDLGQPLATSEENPGSIPMRSQYIAQLGESVDRVVADIDEVAQRISVWLDDETRDSFLQTLDSIDRAAVAITETGDSITSELDGLVARLESLSVEIEQTLVVYRELGESGLERSEEVSTALASLVETSDELGRVLSRLEERTLDGSEHSLLAIEGAAQALEATLEQLQRDPQRLILGASPVSPGPGETRP